METECKWALERQNAPVPEDVQVYHHTASMEFALEKYRAEAERTLAEYSEKVVAAAQGEAFKSNITAAREAVEKLPRSWIRGIVEGALGAAAWTLVLIAFFLILRYLKPDALDIFSHAFGKD